MAKTALTTLLRRPPIRLPHFFHKLSYALGMEIGNGFRKQALDLDPTIVKQGSADAFSGGKTLLSEDEMRAVLTSAKEEYQKKQAALRAEKAQESLWIGCCRSS